MQTLTLDSRAERLGSQAVTAHAKCNVTGSVHAGDLCCMSYPPSLSHCFLSLYCPTKAKMPQKKNQTLVIQYRDDELCDGNIWPDVPLSELQVRRVVDHGGAAAVQTLSFQTEAKERRQDRKSKHQRLFFYQIYSCAIFLLFLNDWFRDVQCSCIHHHLVLYFSIP